MSMAEYMYKLLYGRKTGSSHYKSRHSNYVSDAFAYDNEFIECNRSCNYVQTPYLEPEGAVYPDVCPTWLGNILDSNGYSSVSAMDDGKGSRTPTSVCSTPWLSCWTTGEPDYGQHRSGDPESFYPLPVGPEDYPFDHNEVQACQSRTRKNCRFSSSVDSGEGSDDQPKFSQTLQFQISQHIWENLSSAAPPDGEVPGILQAQGVSATSIAEYCSYADISYSSASSSTSSTLSSLQTQCAEIPYPYSPSRGEPNPAMGLFQGEFPQTDMTYKPTPAADNTVEKLTPEEGYAMGFQRWGSVGPGYEGYCCCPDGGAITLYGCPFSSGQRASSSADLCHGGLKGSESARFDVKPEVKGTARRMRCQMTSEDDVTCGRKISFPTPGKFNSRSPYFSTPNPPPSSTFTTSSSSSSPSSGGETASALVPTSKSLLLLRPEVRLRDGSGSQMCAVCGDNAACQHYGVRTCEGCKGFFKRTVQKGSNYVCLSGKNCPIDKRRRNRCQFCRFQKCLSVGMVKEVVRTDSLKGRRGRLPSKGKTQAQGVIQSPSATPHLTLISGLLRAHVDTSPDFLNLDYSLYMESSGDEEVNHTPPEVVQQLHEILTETANLIRRWADRVPGFRQLIKEDQNTLLKNSLLQLILLRIAFGVDLSDDRVTFPTGLVLHRKQCSAIVGVWMNRIIDFGRSMKSLEADLPTIACLTALVLLKSRKDLKEPAKVESLYASFKSTLRDHCQGQGKHHLLSAIVAKLFELRTICEEGETSLATLASILKSTPSSPLDQLLYDAQSSN